MNPALQRAFAAKSAEIINHYAIRAIFGIEMARARRVPLVTIFGPVISATLFFLVFGAVVGPHIAEIDGLSYGAFIVRGLMMLSLVAQSTSSAAFSICDPKLSGGIYEILSAPVSGTEIVVGYVGAAVTKAIQRWTP